MRFIKKITIGLGFIITAVIFFILGSATIIGIDTLYDRGMHRKVKVIRDIDFVKDDAFYDPDTYPPFKREVWGNIKKGSIGTRTFKKGIVIYVSFSMALPEKDVEYVNSKD